MILVTAATGNIGRPLIEFLVGKGAKVRAVTRNPQAAGLPEGVEVVAADSRRPDTMVTALTGVTSIFVNPRAVGMAAAELLALAGQQGVRRVIGLSASNVDDDTDRQPSRFRGDYNREVEVAVTECGLEWVSLRPTMFPTNTLGLWAGQIRAGDVVNGPYSAAPWAPIHEHDTAAVAAHALLTDDLLCTRPVLTGPQILTQREMVATIGAAIGRTLHYREIPPEAARAAMVAAGFPEGFADAYLALLANAVEHSEPTTDEVHRILDRPARPFADWAAENARAFQN